MLFRIVVQTLPMCIPFFASFTFSTVGLQVRSGALLEASQPSRVRKSPLEISAIDGRAGQNWVAFLAIALLNWGVSPRTNPLYRTVFPVLPIYLYRLS